MARLFGEGYEKGSGPLPEMACCEICGASPAQLYELGNLRLLFCVTHVKAFNVMRDQYGGVGFFTSENVLTGHHGMMILESPWGSGRFHRYGSDGTWFDGTSVLAIAAHKP